MPFSKPILLFILLITSPATATLGSVSIDELLLSPEHQHFASSSPPPKYNPHIPWSYKPYCTAASPRYCVYTSNTTGANGISLVTTPKLAAAAAGLLDEDPLSHFLTQDQAEHLYYNAPPYEIVDDIVGKGKGVVATRLIKKYETFMVDQASVVMDLEIDKDLSEGRKLDLLREAVKRLRRPDSVTSLSGKHDTVPGGENGDGRMEEDIMVTNAFGTTVAGGSFRGLFPLVSRINHACNPNSFVLFSQAGLSIAIKAYRDIQPGEEISVSYLLLGLPSTDRVKGLQRWGFTCTCLLCSLSSAEKEASDSRRTAIASAEPTIQSLWRSGKWNAAIKHAELIAQHMVDEDLASMLTDQYANLARMNLQAGDREKAEEWADQALELLGGMGFLGQGWEGEWDLERLLEVLGARVGGMYAH